MQKAKHITHIPHLQPIAVRPTDTHTSSFHVTHAATADATTQRSLGRYKLRSRELVTPAGHRHPVVEIE
jgi:hypothetical protein